MDNQNYTPEISIIVPVYQVEKYLNRCVDSVLNQTFKDFECILVDDGSTDNSPSICEYYKSKDSRIKVIHKTNGGLSDARNSGIEIAIGKYICFLDGDDCIHHEMLDVLYNTIINNDCEISMCDSCSFYFDVPNTLPTYKFEKYDVYKSMILKPRYSVCNRLYSKQVFENIRFPKGKMFEDQFVIFKLLNDKKIVSTDDKLYYYYQRDDGISKTKTYPENYDFIYSVIEMLKDIPKKEDQCAFYFKKVAYDRLGIMLTNILYQEGQFLNCNFDTIKSIVRDNYKILRFKFNLFKNFNLRMLTTNGFLSKLEIKVGLHLWKTIFKKIKYIINKGVY